MRQDLLSSIRSLAVSGVLAAVLSGALAGPASAGGAPPAPVDTSACSAPALSQPFLSASDSNWYTQIPGETPGNFSGQGWTLTGGAQVTTTRKQDGQSASVLELLPGSTAVSPTVCVSSDYPTARTMVRNVEGGKGVSFRVSYAGTKTANKARETGQINASQNAWTLSDPLSVHPGSMSGWQLVRFTFVAASSEYQLYDFYVDPLMRR